MTEKTEFWGKEAEDILTKLNLCGTKRAIYLTLEMLGSSADTRA